MQPLKGERIVLYTELSNVDSSLCEALTQQLPELDIRQVTSMTAYMSLLREQSCSVTVLDYDISDMREAELLARLRLLDEEPEVLIISRCDNPDVIKRIAQSNRRYVVRDGQLIRSLSHAIRDILRTRRLEREMESLRFNLVRANAQLQERNDRLDDFCATLAHDIRVPLSALSLKIEHLLERQSGTLDSKSRALLEGSLESTRQVLRVVEATYDMSRSRAGTVSMSPLDLKQVIEGVTREIQLTVNRGLQVACEDLPLIRGNRALLERVVLNLIGNSVKYSDQEIVRVVFRAIPAEHPKDESLVQIECLDNGPGIHSQDRAEIFSMFSRGNNQRDKDGLGVGLSIVERIVELHGGTVRLLETEEANQGCRFLISLPQAS